MQACKKKADPSSSPIRPKTRLSICIRSPGFPVSCAYIFLFVRSKFTYLLVDFRNQLRFWIRNGLGCNFFPDRRHPTRSGFVLPNFSGNRRYHWFLGDFVDQSRARLLLLKSVRLPRTSADRSRPISPVNFCSPVLALHRSSSY